MAGNAFCLLAGTEKHARKSWSAHMLLGIGPAVLLGLAIARYRNEFRGWEGILSGLGIPICVALGALVGSLPVARKIKKRPVSLTDLLTGHAITFLVLAPGVTVFLVMLILLIPYQLGLTSISIMAGGLLLAVALTLGLMVPILRVLGLLAPAPPRLIEIVRDASERAQIPPPRVHLLRWAQANAFAFPFSRMLAFTKPALEILTDDQLRAICLHEIAHLQELTSAKLTRLSGLLVIFPFFTMPVWVKSFGIAGFLVPLAIFFIGLRLLGRFSQRMENEADAAAYAKDDATEAGCYAGALERIHEYNVVPAVMRGSSQSHPHLYDRLIAAGVTPDYPRPKAPSIGLFVVAILLMVVGTIVSTDFVERSLADANAPDYHADFQTWDVEEAEVESEAENLAQ